MEDLSGQVLQGFGIRAKRIAKEKSYYICSTDGGPRVIRKTADTRAHIMFQHALKEQLSERGFGGLDRYFPAEGGTPFFEHEGGVYVMTGLFKQREADFASTEDFGRVIRRVAEFHRAARGLSFEPPVCGDGDITALYRKQAAEIDGIKKLIGQRKRMSDFDVMFLKNYGAYRRMMSEAIQLLERTGLTALKAAARSENAVCHNLLKEEHLLLDGDGVYMTGFSQAAVDYFIFDLCALIQRYAKNLGRARLGVGEIAQMYDSHRPLSRDDIEILRGLLIYPGKFVKICRQYYSKNRTWTPVSIINRMDDIVKGKDEYQRFVEGLRV